MSKPTGTGKVQAPPVVDEGPAPFTYFDEAPNFGNNGQIINVTLAAYRNILQQDGTIKTDLLVTSHLRCSLMAATALRDALNQAIQMSKPPPNTVAN